MRFEGRRDVWRYCIVGVSCAGGASAGWEQDGRGEEVGFGVWDGGFVEGGSGGIRTVCMDWTMAPAPPGYLFIITRIRIRICIIIRIRILYPSPTPIIHLSSSISIPIRIPISVSVSIITIIVPVPVGAAAIRRPGWRVSGHGCGYGDSEPGECEQQCGCQFGWQRSNWQWL